jgi:hypothetical protein
MSAPRPKKKACLEVDSSSVRRGKKVITCDRSLIQRDKELDPSLIPEQDSAVEEETAGEMQLQPLQKGRRVATTVLGRISLLR